MKTLIIYHNDDNDGVFSGAIALYHEIHKYVNEPIEVTFMGLDYNQADRLKSGASVTVKGRVLALDKIIEEYDRLIIVDFSFPVEQMSRWLAHFGKNFIWCDHHAPIIKAADEAGLNIEGIRDPGHSAMYHAWTYFIGTDVPRLIDILQKYDSWTFTEEERDLCFTVNAGVNAKYGITLESAYDVITHLVHEIDALPSIDELYALGKSVLNEERRKDRKMIQTKGDFGATVDGRPAVMILHGYNTGSMTFESVKEFHPECKHAVALKRNADGCWTISMYNIYDDEEFHCGEYCRAHYNGGGHRGAAGGQISQEKAFELIISKKF